MKTLYLTFLLAVTLCPLMAQTENGKRAVNSVTEKASAGNIRGLIDVLPGLEPVWAEDPKAYLEALKAGVHTLMASDNPEAVKAAMATFPKLMEKKSPAETGAAISYITLKAAIIENYFQPEENRYNKESLLMAATFLGEIRSLRIPGYENKREPVPGHEILQKAGVHEVADLPTEAQKQAVAAAVKQDEENMKMNLLQNRLFSADANFAAIVLAGAKRNLAIQIPENQKFYQELVKRAKLTDAEVKQLSQP